MPRNTNKGGRKPRVSDEDFLDVFRATTDPVLSTAEVAEQVPIKRRGTLNRLQALEEDDRLESKQIGGRNTVWWLVDERNVPVTGRFEQRGEVNDVVEGSAAPVNKQGETRTEDALDVTEAIASVDTPGSGETLERRRNALQEMYDYLKEHGAASKSDFEALVDTKDVGYASFGSFWTNYVKAKDALKQLPNVDAPGEGEHTWRYTA